MVNLPQKPIYGSGSGPTPEAEPPKEPSTWFDRALTWLKEVKNSVTALFMRSMTPKLKFPHPLKPFEPTELLKKYQTPPSSTGLKKVESAAKATVAPSEKQKKEAEFAQFCKQVESLKPGFVDQVQSWLFAAASTQFGHGIENGGHSCYVNSVVQGLRAVESFRELQEAPTPPLPDYLAELIKDSPGEDLRDILGDDDILLIQNELKTKLFELLAALEGDHGATQSAAKSNEIRNLAIALGFPISSPGRSDTQEDAQSLLLFVLDQIGFQPGSFKKEILHEVGGVVPSLDRQRGPEACLTLDISQAAEGASIQDLLVERRAEEAFEPHNVQSETAKFYAPDLGMMPLSREDRDTYRAARAEIPTRTLQTIQIEGAPPKMLLLSLKRYSSDPITQESSKLSKTIRPSDEIWLPKAGPAGEKVHYKLRAITVHEGSRSIKGGHYYTYAPKVVNNQPAWFEYNDSRVKKHTNLNGGGARSPYENASRNGYVFFYELIQ